MHDTFASLDNFTLVLSPEYHNVYELMFVSPIYKTKISFPFELNQDIEYSFLQQINLQNSNLYRFLVRRDVILFNKDVLLLAKILQIDIVPYFFAIMSLLKIDIFLQKDEIYIRKISNNQQTVTNENFYVLDKYLIDLNLIEKIYNSINNELWGNVAEYKEDLLMFCLAMCHRLFNNALINSNIPYFNDYLEELISCTLNRSYSILNILYYYVKICEEVEKFLKNIKEKQIEDKIFINVNLEVIEERHKKFNKLFSQISQTELE